MHIAIDMTSKVYWHARPDRRATPRTSVRLSSQIEDERHKTAYVVIGDISTDGFSFRSFEFFAPGERISVELAGIGLRPAEVIWEDGVRTGCRFETPIDETRLAALIASQQV